MNEFAVLSLSYNVFDSAFNIQAITSTPCHLTAYYTFTEPQRHKYTRIIRGLETPWGAYFCFVAWFPVEQHEAGDTLIHTFYFPTWYFGQLRWFILKGTVGGVDSPSTSPIFKFVRPWLLSFIATHDDGWLEFTPGDYPTQHDSPVASFIQDGNYPRYFISQWISPGGIRVRRMGLFFDTSSFAKSNTIYAARMAIFAIRAGTTPFDAVLVNGDGIHHPLQFADYGWLLNQKTNLGSAPLQPVVGWHYLNLTPYGLWFLRPESITPLGLRSSLDIAYKAPTGIEFAYIYSSYSGVPPTLTIAYYP